MQGYGEFTVTHANIKHTGRNDFNYINATILVITALILHNAPLLDGSVTDIPWGGVVVIVYFIFKCF